MHLAIFVVLAAMFFMAYLSRGRDREVLRRCVACGARYGERHHRDCQYKNRT